jgi:hypothetical protein
MPTEDRPYMQNDSNAARMLGTLLLLVIGFTLAFIGACSARAQGDYSGLVDNPGLIPATMKPGVVSISTAVQLPPLQVMEARILMNDSGEVVGILQADVLGLMRKDERTLRQRRRDETRERRKNMTFGEKFVDHASEQWPWYVGIAAAAVVDQTVIKEQGWLWHKKSSGKSSGGDLIGDDTTTGIANAIHGNNNTINQTIILQQGGQSGAANTGTQMPPM